MKKDLEVTRTVQLGPDDVALVWHGGGRVTACVSDAKLRDTMPAHMVQALSVLLSVDDPEIIGRMWQKLEKRMDEERGKEKGTASLL